MHTKLEERRVVEPHPYLSLPNAKYFVIDMDNGRVEEFKYLNAAARWGFGQNKKCGYMKTLVCAQNKNCFICI